MDEPLDKRTLLLSALWGGAGQLASGRTERGLILVIASTVFSILGGVLGVKLKLLTGGRRPIRALPATLNPLALVWLGIYLYSLYDAYNIATGADAEDADLLDYEEYTPQDTAESYSAGASGAASPTEPSRLGSEASSTGPNRARITTALADAEAADPAAVGGSAADIRSADVAVPGVAPSGSGDHPPAADTGAGADGIAAAHPARERSGSFDFSGSGLDWSAGVSKADLMAALGDDAQVRGVFGQYLPADRSFHSADEALNLIPVQAWQDAQGQAWTGGDLPTANEPSGYLDSAAGRMPPGDQSAGTVS